MRNIIARYFADFYKIIVSEMDVINKYQPRNIKATQISWINFDVFCEYLGVNLKGVYSDKVQGTGCGINSGLINSGWEHVPN